MKTSFFKLISLQTRRACLAMTMVVSAALFSGANAHATTPIVLQFTASAQNISGDEIILNSPLLNKKPSLKLIVTQYWTGTYNATPVGVMYSGTQWCIYNENEAAMPVGASFNVLVSNQATYATPLNSAGIITYLTLEKKNPSGVLLFTHLYDPFPTLGGVYANHNMSLYYDTSFKKWSIFTDDSTPPLAIAYNLADETKNKNAFVLTTGTNIDGYDGVYINNAVANNNANAVVLVSPVYGAYWDHPVGVYNSGGTWDIFNEDKVAMEAGLKFNVVVFSGTSK